MDSKKFERFLSVDSCTIKRQLCGGDCLVIGPMIISLVVRPFTIMAPRPLQKVVNEQLHPTGSSSVKDLRQCGVINELVCETGRLQAVDKYHEGEWPEIRSLRHSSPYQLPFTEDVSNCYALP